MVTPWLDDYRTVFGGVIGPDDQRVVNDIIAGDRMISIVIDGDYSELTKDYKDQLER